MLPLSWNGTRTHVRRQEVAIKNATDLMMGVPFRLGHDMTKARPPR
jgi:hypothetical protein